jgi:hypothetical protein
MITSARPLVGWLGLAGVVGDGWWGMKCGVIDRRCGEWVNDYLCEA